MGINVVSINDQMIHLIHERVPDLPMEIWQRGTPLWYWNFIGGAVRGSNANLFVAIELAMTDLTKQVEGDPRDAN